MEELVVSSEEELSSSVRCAYEGNNPLIVVGGGTLLNLGLYSDYLQEMGDKSRRNYNETKILRTSQLTGIHEYESGDLYISVWSGTKLREIKRELSENKQRLAFDPPNLDKFLRCGRQGKLSGMIDIGESSIGGVMSAGLSGPGSVLFGGARDYIMGFRGVDGRGTVFKNGGRVVKNVAGYDVSKLMVGSRGIFSVISRYNLRLQPLAEKTVTFIIESSSVGEGCEMLRGALSVPAQISGASWLSGGLMRGLLADNQEMSQGATLIAVEGYTNSYQERVDILRKVIGYKNKEIMLEDTESRELWDKVRDLEVFCQEGERDRVVWKVSIAPGECAKAVSELGNRSVLVDKGGRVFFFSHDINESNMTSKLMTIIKRYDAHVSLYRSPREMRDGFMYKGDSELLGQIKDRLAKKFDPSSILNKVIV